MGCVSSKIVARSRSFREDLRRSLKRRTDGLPALDDILISKNGGDQFLALVCTANTVAKKLQNGNLVAESATEADPTNKQTNQESINTKVLILMDDLEEKQGQQQQQESIKEGSIIFDGSPQLAIEGQCPIQCDKINAVQDNGPMVNGGSLVHTRSIHTVEEYDAMVEVGHPSSQVEQDGQDEIIHHLSQNANDQCVGSLGRSFNECLMVKGEDKKEQHTANDHKPNHVQVVTATVEDVNFTNEKGFRRKAKAKELATLSIPTTVDFPDLGNFGNWIESRNQVFSNGEYVTPKFGKFCIANPAYGGGECKVFDPEMLASFEEVMKQLTEEEECILQQIVENLKEESVGKEENAIYLSGYNLEGYLQNFGQMEALEIIDLHNNNLRGPIPDFLGEFPNLRVLNLANNNFEGSIPKSILNNDRISFNASGNPDLKFPKNKKKIGLIVGLTIGMLIVVVVLCLTVTAFLRRSRSSKRRTSSPSSTQ